MSSYGYIINAYIIMLYFLHADIKMPAKLHLSPQLDLNV